MRKTEANRFSRVSAPQRVNSRKSQIKMFETVAVLVVFFFILVFGVQFYFGIQKASFQKELDRITSLKAVGLVLKAQHLPEFDCAIFGVTTENCFDVEKLKTFAEATKDDTIKQLYSGIFGRSVLNITQVYPGDGTTKYGLYENVLEGAGIEDKTQVPVQLYDPLTDEYYFGMLEVTVYAK
ncbi:hypothetical protein HY642_00865 [Candidatus Woesearchaeota archaeon]|nr:hypothetical protein [Candidatus Woesearchaeota archaeon]